MNNEAIADVLANNRKLLSKIIDNLKEPKIDKLLVTIYIEKIDSSLETLQTLLAKGKGRVVVTGNATGNQVPLPIFLDDVETDNPEQEDLDAKKQREAQRSFYG